MAANQTRTSTSVGVLYPEHPLKLPHHLINIRLLLFITNEENGMMDVGSGHGLAIAGSAKDLEVAGTGSVGCHFSILS